MLKLPQPVLVVDNYPVVIQVIGNLLRACGVTDVESAPNADAALTKLRRGAFSVVISDWGMEPASGLDLLRSVRLDPKVASIPFLLMSAAVDGKRAAQAIAAGADNLHIKPFDKQPA